MSIEKIVIVGGGTAGWMTAVALSRLKSGSKLEIQLIESEQIGTVGVGEATIPPFVEFNQLLGIDERALLSAVQGTFKVGIQFENWGKLGDSYIHPFGNYGYELGGIAFHQVWRKLQVTGDKRPLQVFNLETMSAFFGKFARTADYQKLGDVPPMNYAYHINATAYAGFLRTDAEARGVVRREGRSRMSHWMAKAATSHRSPWMTARSSPETFSSIARAFVAFLSSKRLIPVTKTGRSGCLATALWRSRASAMMAARRRPSPKRPPTARAGNGKCPCNTATAMATSIAVNI